MLMLIILCYTIPLDSPIMNNIEYLQLRGLIDVPSVKPYEMEWLIPQIDEILMKEIELNEVDKNIFSYFGLLLTKDPSFSYFLHVSFEYENSPELYYGFIDERIGGQLIKDVIYSHGLRIRRANELDRLGPKPWKNYQVYLNEGLIRFNHKKINFDIGRRNFLLGPGDEYGLLLSMDPQGYDGFYLFIPTRYFEFYNIFSVIDAPRNRFLSIHRLGLNLKKFLKIGFSEAILFGGSLEPIYLNFLLPYYLAQWGADRDDNIMWCFDVQMFLFHSIVYGELLIDDYMYEDDPYPDKLAYQLGIKSLISKRFLTKINYTFVDKWVYTQRRRINVHERNGHPLGFPLGNDVDRISFSIKFMNKYGIYPNLSVNYTRKGEGSIYRSYEEEGGTWNPPFPSGVVEKNVEITMGFDSIIRRNFYIKLNLGKQFWKNKDHIAGEDDEFLFNVALRVVM